MLIDNKKDLHRGSYRHFLTERQPIDLDKIRVSTPRDSFQASYGIEGFLREQAYFEP